ncbi:MAG: site-specific recombinase [Rhodospirillaceae bacterium]|nr:MAG: site-specific recombinase [Rhodospirillaceae bacterium]
MEAFDRAKVTFVSVTQQFNTTTSMGRLTLNILLSFAQFEREVTAERIRDKFAASRKKSMWMGGVPPLGYDVDNRRLVVNPKEAALIRDIFERFTRIGSATQLVKELRKEGARTKSQSGKRHEGIPIDKGFLYKLLRNLGDVVHKEQVHPGEHEAIIDPALWAKVHDILGVSPRTRARQTCAKTPMPLKGLRPLRFGDDAVFHLAQRPVVPLLSVLIGHPERP